MKTKTDETARTLAMWIRKFSWEEDRENGIGYMKAESEPDEDDRGVLDEVSENIARQVVDIKAAQFTDAWSNVETDWDIRDGVLRIEASMYLAEE